MAHYSVVGDTTNTAGDSLGYFCNSATRPARLKLHDLVLGSSTDAAAACEYQVRNMTAENMTPGGTSVTPFQLDQDDAASNGTAIESPTGEPTYSTGAAYEIGLNQRATFRLTTYPGRELVCISNDDDGWGVISNVAASAWLAHFTMVWEE